MIAEPRESMRRGVGALRRHWVIWTVVMAAVVAFGIRLWSEVRPLLAPKYEDVSYTVPSAPRLVAAKGETVYRIDPTQSQVSYGVNERIAFAASDHATGSTNGIAGDIAVNLAQPSASRVGDIVVNLEELHSDNSLRDARLRAAFLGSHQYPLARFTTRQVVGLPATIVEGQSYAFTIDGDLTVRTIIAPVSWTVRATLSHGQLVATATTTIKQSTFRIGPISVAGLVTTSDDVALTFKLVALDPSRFTVPAEIAAPVRGRHSGTGPSFARYVQPVLEQDCASCHNAGQVGAAHWQLSTALDAAKIADGIRVVTQARFMPPWPASSLSVPFLHPKTLDAKTIAVLAQWAAAGGKLDVPPSTPIKPAPGAGGPRPRADVVLRMPQPYTGSPAVPNDYRCFVLDPHFTQPTFLTGYAFAPDQIREIHHAQVFHLTGAEAALVQAREGGDGRPGWQCYSGPGLTAPALSGPGPHPAFDFIGEAGLIAGWAPGQDPFTYQAGAGILFQPGDVVVLQIHYHYDQAPTPDQSTLSLQTEPGSAGLRQVVVVNPLAPVEIPCAPGAQAPLCDRKTALADDFRLYGPIGGVEDALLGLCGKTPSDVTAGFDGVTAHSSCDSTVPASGQIVDVFGHMHILGKSVRLTLDPGTPRERVLLDIPTWNFDWQMVYTLATPLHVEAGETIRLDCTWDRSVDPNRPPKYIVFAEGTEDEMCFSTYALIPDQQP